MIFAAAAGVVLVVGVAIAYHEGRTASAGQPSAGRQSESDATRPSAASQEGKSSVKADSVVSLDATSLQLVHIELERATTIAGAGLVANGTITYDANHVSSVAPRAEGRVVSVRADLGQHVGVGAVLAVVESPEVGSTRGELAKARAAVEATRQNYEREKRLYDQQITPQKELIEAQANYKSAQADFDAASAKLAAYGAAAGPSGAYGLVTPIAGVVVERNANPGQIVGPTTNLFTVADLRRVWITVDVYEADLARVRRGATAFITPRALVGESFRGRVTFAGGIVDTVSRTFKVRVEIDNTAQRLRPGMYAQIRIEAPMAPRNAPANPESNQQATGVVVPALAVQDVNGKTVVFVPGGEGGQFIARPVMVGSKAGGEMVAITKGLRSGEQVVVQGAFQLKAEMMKASFGDDDR